MYFHDAQMLMQSRYHQMYWCSVSCSRDARSPIVCAVHQVMVQMYGQCDSHEPALSLAMLLAPTVQLAHRCFYASRLHRGKDLAHLRQHQALTPKSVFLQ